MWPWWKSCRRQSFFTGDLVLTLPIRAIDCRCPLFVILLLLLVFSRLQTLQHREMIDLWRFVQDYILCFHHLFVGENSSAARAEISLAFRLDLQEVEATCSREQRSFSFVRERHWLCALFALIYCPLTKTCDYTPFFLSSFPLQKLLFLICYKSHNWGFFKGRCGCIGHYWSGCILFNAVPPLFILHQPPLVDTAYPPAHPQQGHQDH